jgi:hypothetical protein
VRNVGASRLGVEKSDDAVGIVKIRQTRSGLVNGRTCIRACMPGSQHPRGFVTDFT